MEHQITRALRALSSRDATDAAGQAGVTSVGQVVGEVAQAAGNIGDALISRQEEAAAAGQASLRVASGAGAATQANAVHALVEAGGAGGNALSVVEEVADCAGCASLLGDAGGANVGASRAGGLRGQVFFNSAALGASVLVQVVVLVAGQAGVEVQTLLATGLASWGLIYKEYVGIFRLLFGSSPLSRSSRSWCLARELRSRINCKYLRCCLKI